MFSSCLNPQRFKNRYTGEYVTAPCGRCAYCREQRRKIWARRIQLHAESSAYVLFFTLTYDNYHLPLIHYNEKGTVTDFTYTKERIVYNRHTGERKEKIVRVFDDSFNGLNVLRKDIVNDKILFPPHFVKRRLDKDNFIYDETNSFAVVYKPDFQNFIKRLRSNLGREFADSSFDPSFTYFAVSEYGPETFRPHFHGLLFFSSCPPSLDALLPVLTKSWSKSSSDEIGRQFEPVKDKAQSAVYVSKYVCKDTTLPPIYASPEFCTSSFKSISIPLGSESFDIADIPFMFDEGTLLYERQYYNEEKHCYEPYKLAYPRSAWNRVFPKLLGQRHISTRKLRQLFERIFDFKDCPESLPNHIKDFPKKYPLRCDAGLLYEDTVESFIRVFNGLDDSDDISPLFDYYKSRPFKKSCEHFNVATYSYFTDRLLRDDIDFYLFGIPVNRAFCNKVLSCANRYKFLSTPASYTEFYRRFTLVGLKDILCYQHEQYDELPCAYEFASIYTDYVDDLPPILGCLSDLGRYSSVELTLSNFGLTVEDFYNPDGTKKTFDFTNARDNLAHHLFLKEKAHKIKSIYQSQIHLDL